MEQEDDDMEIQAEKSDLLKINAVRRMDEDEISCRICLESSNRQDVIAPCSCSGSSRWVHRECLDRWRTTREDRAFSKCTECLTPYKFVPRVDDRHAKCVRNVRFLCYCARDIVGALIAAQFVVLSFAFMVYLGDKNSRYLVELFECEGHALLLYYVCGMILALAGIGIFYSIMLCCRGRSSRNMNRHECDNCCLGCATPGYSYYPIYVYPDVAPNCCCCCECGPECSGLSCDGCTCAECTSGAGCGEEAAIFVLIAMVIFVLIGIIVSVFAGIVFVQQVYRTHVHILQKQSLAKDFIVEDLAASGGIDLEMGTLNNKTISMNRDDDHSDSEPLHSEDTVAQGYMTRDQQRELDRMGLL